MNSIQIAALILIVCGVALPVMCVIKMYLIEKFKKKAIFTEAVITNTEKRRLIKAEFITYSACNTRYMKQAPLLPVL